MISLSACDATRAQALCAEYSEAFVDHLEAEEAGDLESRLAHARRLSNLASRMEAAGLDSQRLEIEDANKW
jgi:hypothetical protein